MQYIRVSANALGKLQPVTETQIAQYYQENKAQFIVKISAYSIINRERSGRRLSRTAKGADFAELAKTKSLDKLLWCSRR